MKVKGVTRQQEGGGYYRVRLPLGALTTFGGHETSVEQAKSDVKSDGADVIVGQVIGGHNRWWRSMARHAKLVYELDDDPFELDPVNPMHRIYSDPVAQDSIGHCLRIADLVTVSTEPLAERMRKHNPNVVVLPNYIEEALLELERPCRDKLTIGWAGSASHRNDIRSVTDGLRKTLDRHDVEAHFIGADFRSLVKRPMRFTPWALKTTDYYELIDFDIGIAPLVPTVFAQCKSHIKALEYAALGIPVIASDSEPYRDFVIDGVTGFLVRYDHEWSLRLRDLVNDTAMREEMGRKAKAHAAQWTIQEHWRKWETAYASVCP